jgi:hypothetical protein
VAAAQTVALPTEPIVAPLIARLAAQLLNLDREIKDLDSLGPSAASRPVPRLLGKAELLCLKSGVPEGGDHDEPVAVPLGGLAELDVERLPVGGMTLPSGRVISPVKVPWRGKGARSTPEQADGRQRRKKP